MIKQYNDRLGIASETTRRHTLKSRITEFHAKKFKQLLSHEFNSTSENQRLQDCHLLKEKSLLLRFT